MNSNEKAPLTYHRIIESLKFAYAPFTFLTDPAFNNNTEKVSDEKSVREVTRFHPTEKISKK